jgi:branched-chain amino acid transport system permease protein
MFSPFADSIIITTCINILLAWSFYVPVATGKFFAGQFGLMAVGAYVAAGAQHGLGLPLVLGVILAMAASVPLSWIIAVMSLRLSGFALAITSLGFGLVLQVILNNVGWAGATYGIRNLSVDTTVTVAALAVIFVGLLLALVARSRHGLAVAAARSDAVAAEATGIHIRRYQVAGVVIAGVIAALAGALYAHQIGFVQPDLFGYDLLVSMASWVFFGGTTTLIGPFFGAIALSVLPDAIASLYDYRLVAYSIIVILVVRLRPNGLITRNGVAAVVRRVKRTWPSTRPPEVRPTKTLEANTSNVQN